MKDITPSSNVKHENLIVGVKLAPAVRHLVSVRCESLGLKVSEYLRALISQDIHTLRPMTIYPIESSERDVNLKSDSLRLP